jgi:hypothetical protein
MLLNVTVVGTTPSSNVVAGAVAHGVFVDSAYTASNFGQLRVVTSADHTDLHQLKAAGWLEGYLTAGACLLVPLLASSHPIAHSPKHLLVCSQPLVMPWCADRRRCLLLVRARSCACTWLLLLHEQLQLRWGVGVSTAIQATICRPKQLQNVVLHYESEIFETLGGRAVVLLCACSADQRPPPQLEALFQVSAKS